jgi:UDP-N-acetyl-D-mannosaminuronate dehydrogenase
LDGRKGFTTTTPKVVGGFDQVSGDLAQALYDQIILADQQDETLLVSSCRVGEADEILDRAGAGGVAGVV